MVWKTTCVNDERMRFIVACLDGLATITSICRGFGISRKTGYKWIARYEAEGPGGIEDRSRAPHSNPRALGVDVVHEVLAVRRRYPTWGPRKVKAYLEDRHGDRPWPSASAIGDLFAREGLTRPHTRPRRSGPWSLPFAGCEAPNDVWCVDFKGPIATGDGTRVAPLTLSDAHSRYLLRCEALERSDEAHVWPVLSAAFKEYGLPKAMRSDNGPPFAGRAVAGLSSLAVKLIKAGVLPQRIAPGKPQQNGRHERMHLTLKQDTACPPAKNLAAQIDRFQDFRQTYNHERPHEALGQVPPARIYRTSPRAWDGVLRSPDYPDDAEIRRVSARGEIEWMGGAVFVSKALCGEPVALFALDDHGWLIKFGPIPLGTLAGRCQRPNLEPI